MKNTKLHSAIYYLSAILFIIFLNCKSQVKPGPVGIKIPGLQKKYITLHKFYKNVKNKLPESNGVYDIFKDEDSAGYCVQAAYDEKSEKIYLTIAGEGEGVRVSQNLVILKDKKLVMPGEAWIDIDDGDNHTQENMTEADIKNLLAKF